MEDRQTILSQHNSSRIERVKSNLANKEKIQTSVYKN